jgi:type IV pilus assembly protein PilA
MVELLVVVLIIGILAAVAIPSFLVQNAKAVDSQAKELARTAETAAETIATDNAGGYQLVTKEELNKYESSIRIVPSGSATYLSAATPGKNGYSVTAKAGDGDEFTISRSPNGTITRQCLSPVSKTGCAGAETSSW